MGVDATKADSSKAESMPMHVEQVLHTISNDDDSTQDYKLTWRTVLAVFALSVAFAATTFGVVGPNSAIDYMVADYPDQSANATWIASAPLLGIVTLPPLYGAISDRYGKKWMIVIGSVIAMVGALVSAFAQNINTIIGGQAINATGAIAMSVAVAAGMEVVPAKQRVLVVAMMSVINGALGVMGGVYVFSACVEHGLGWRWGFKSLAIIYPTACILVAAFYNPPPTRLRRELGQKNLFATVDFIGVFLLAASGVLITVPLIWGGATYPWNSKYVISLLVVAPFVIAAFIIYEWKGRRDGIMHHAFFETSSFPVFIAFGFVDGMILYGTSVFLPNQIRGLYKSEPLDAAEVFTAFNGSLLAGFFIFGWVSTKFKQFRWPLVSASAGLTLVAGLLTRAVPSDLAYFEGLIAFLGILTAAIQVLPVAGVGLVVPSSLIATANTVLGSMRGLGGVIGIAVYTAIFNTKAQGYVPAKVGPVLLGAEIPPSSYDQIFGLLRTAPQMLATVPGITPQLFGAIMDALKVGQAEAYMYVWYCIMAVSAACLILAFFIVDVPEKMTDMVESALEPSYVREKQKQIV